MRMIDVDKLKEYIDDCKCCEKCDKIGFMCNEDCELPDFLTPQWERVLNEQPTVDAEPVRHGTWRHYEHMLTCSECGTVFDDDIMEYFGEEVPKYCPECGAKMDGEQEKENA